MADARYQIAKVREGAIDEVLFGGTANGVTTGSDTTIELSSYIFTREMYDPVSLYVEALSAPLLVKRSSGEPGWRIPTGGYAWFTLSDGHDLIMREVA